MMRLSRTIPVMLLLFAVACSSTPAVPEGATADQVYDMAEQARSAGDAARAISLYQRVYEDFPASPRAETAEWLAAETAFADGRYAKARDIYRDYHEFHPVSRLGDLGDRMYEIGEKLYANGQSGAFGLGIFPTTAGALATMTWITEKLRNGEKADDAYMFLARARIEERNYEAAADDLNALLDTYPESEWALSARYLLGDAWLSENRGPAYDVDSLLAARDAFTAYIKEVEKSDARKTEYADQLRTAHEKLDEVKERLAEKNLLIADFYLSVERPEAARIYLETTRSDYSDTPAAKQADEMIRKLPPAPKDRE